eukprot:CAMPEP_0168423346 /NCGR_PEP_ID=MMETSP0228-20121227/34261_1 /TAXON_ID=133427 /ORGANISM="Protoceratium reticulatum, Strain CCCM 535 (=CCMP 1889)" /LENGTH=168 /DNA_ID=CAMNT_0008437305 /DNA_START=19 /DNA_END=522 /DNA_ORIENTATION=+
MAGGTIVPDASEGRNRTSDEWVGDWTVVKEILTLAEAKEFEVYEAILSFREEQVRGMQDRLSDAQAEIRSLCPLDEGFSDDLSEPGGACEVPAGSGWQHKAASGPGESMRQSDPEQPALAWGLSDGMSTEPQGPLVTEPLEVLRCLREKDQLLSLGLNWLAAELQDTQ